MPELEAQHLANRAQAGTDSAELALQTVDPVLGGDPFLRREPHDQRVPSLTAQVNKILMLEGLIE